MRVRALVVAVLGVCLAAPLPARTLAEVKARGTLSMCANPDALPHSSQRADPPGFQIEIGRALAATALAPPDELVDVVRVRTARVLAHAGERRLETPCIVITARARVLHHGASTVVVPGRGAVALAGPPVTPPP